MNDIKDISLAKSGKDKIDWVRSYMPVLSRIEQEFIKTQPFAGMKIAMSIHLEAKTAYLAKVLRNGGAEVAVTGCNPLSTQDDVAAALAAEGFTVNAYRGVTEAQYTEHLKRTLSIVPDLMIDDGGDLPTGDSHIVPKQRPHPLQGGGHSRGSQGFQTQGGDPGGGDGMQTGTAHGHHLRHVLRIRPLRERRVRPVLRHCTR